MSTQTRLDYVLENSETVFFNDFSKLVIFSDCHRGDGSKADDFMKNEGIYNAALDYYYRNGYTYIEAGDGDELWENRRFLSIYKAHKDTFGKLKRFYDIGRLYFIFGNHDIVKPHKLADNKLYGHILFKDVRFHEGIVLKHIHTGNRIFIVHGHQGDLINDRLWFISRFIVRYILRPLQIYGLQNPFSPAINYKKKSAVEDGMKQWAWKRNMPIIAGHTHRPCIPNDNGTPYYNCGCCVNPGGITCIEVSGRSIRLVEWQFKEIDENSMTKPKYSRLMPSHTVVSSTDLSARNMTIHSI